jgi:hypothetical protein
METYLLLYKHQKFTSYKYFSSLKKLQIYIKEHSVACHDSVVCLLCCGEYVPLYANNHPRDVSYMPNFFNDILNDQYQFLKSHLTEIEKDIINLS